jgi:hypothetical protein
MIKVPYGKVMPQSVSQVDIIVVMTKELKSMEASAKSA